MKQLDVDVSPPANITFRLTLSDVTFDLDPSDLFIKWCTNAPGEVQKDSDAYELTMQCAPGHGLKNEIRV